jgi:RNA polymerase sigma factor (sigma-70 family)
MDDQVLLAQYVETNDPMAFEEITLRYAGLVKGVCKRILGNSHDAEEVAQECFLELAKDARNVHSSVAGWLHRTATTRSLNVLRSRSRRKIREREVTVGKDMSAVNDVTGNELRRIIESALTAMPEDLRLPMILHFVDGRSQRDVALALGVNQSTISRRMHDALRQLREKLTQAGYAASIPAIMVAMQNQADAVPESGLVTVAVAGTAGNAAASTTIASGLKGTAVALAPIASYFLVGGWFSLLIALFVAVYVARFRPIWLADVYSSLGVKDIYDQPTFCLGRWNWEQPPSDWRMRVQSSLVWSLAFLGLTVAFAIGPKPAPWGIVLLGGCVTVGLIIHALRIIVRVRQVRNTLPAVAQRATGGVRRGFWSQLIGFRSHDPTLNWFDAIQLFGIGLTALVIAAQVVVSSQNSAMWPVVVLAGMTGAMMFIWGVWLFARLFVVDGLKQGSPATSALSSEQTGAARSILTIGAATIAALSIWILWNPASVRGLAQSLAAVQTSMLGWIVYRFASRCQAIELKFARRSMIAVVVGCLVLNSSVCLANWLW